MKQPYYYETQERCMAPGIADGWPEVIAAPHTKNGRLFRCQGSHALLDVAAERRRQQEAEGWTPAHDDQHIGGELAQAAVCYASTRRPKAFTQTPSSWPWSSNWWKPKTRRKDLVRAAALLLAEIERLDRRAP